jgi:hypothetical protein
MGVVTLLKSPAVLAAMDPILAWSMHITTTTC